MHVFSIRSNIGLPNNFNWKIQSSWYNLSSHNAAFLQSLRQTVPGNSRIFLGWMQYLIVCLNLKTQGMHACLTCFLICRKIRPQSPFPNDTANLRASLHAGRFLHTRLIRINPSGFYCPDSFSRNHPTALTGFLNPVCPADDDEKKPESISWIRAIHSYIW